MSRSARTSRLPHCRWFVAGRFDQAFQRAGLQMRLIAQRNDPVRDRSFPSRPLRGALDRTKHAALGRRVDDGIGGCSSAKSLLIKNFVVRGANKSDLCRARICPLVNQMVEDCRPAPGQQELWPAHARGAARAEYDNRELKITYCQLGFSGRQASNSLTSAAS